MEKKLSSEAGVVLRWLVNTGRWGARHTNVSSIAARFRRDPKAFNSAIQELVVAGFVTVHKTQREDHISINPSSAGKVRTILTAKTEAAVKVTEKGRTVAKTKQKYERYFEHKVSLFGLYEFTWGAKEK